MPNFSNELLGTFGMFSKTGRKLHNKLILGKTHKFKRNKSTKPHSQQENIRNFNKFTERLLKSKNLKKQPFALAGVKKFTENKAKAPPPGFYAPKMKNEAKIMRLYGKEMKLLNSLVINKKIVENRVLLLQQKRELKEKTERVETESLEQQQKEKIPKIHTKRNSKSCQLDKEKNHFGMTTVNSGFIDFKRQMPHKQFTLTHKREFDIDTKTAFLSTNPRATTDIYFTNKHNKFRPMRKKFVRKQMFYNVKYHLLKERENKSVIDFRKDIGRQMYRQKENKRDFIDYDVIGKRIPNVYLDK